MGCFDFHCAITGVSISNGEEVLHVVKRFPTDTQFPDLGRNYSTYDLLKSFSYAKSESERPLRFHAWLLEKGAVAPGTPYPEPENTLEVLNEVEDLYLMWGTYNDYGWTNEWRDDKKGEYIHFMVHRDVALKVAEFCSKDTNNIFEVGRAVAEFLYMCRVNPWYTLAGVQHFDEAEQMFHRERIKLIDQTLKNKWED